MAEFLIEASEISVGDKLLITGPTTGAVFVEQIPAHCVQGSVGHRNHQSACDVGCNNTCKIHHAEGCKSADKAGQIRILLTDGRNDVIVDDRFQHIGADDARKGADHQTEGNDNQQPAAAFQIGKDAKQRLQRVSRFLISMTWWWH